MPFGASVLCTINQVHAIEEDIAMEDPASVESKILSSLLVCPNCGGQLALVGKAITATPDEVAANVRSRSARLRVAERTG